MLLLRTMLLTSARLATRPPAALLARWRQLDATLAARALLLADRADALSADAESLAPAVRLLAADAQEFAADLHRLQQEVGGRLRKLPLPAVEWFALVEHAYAWATNLLERTEHGLDTLDAGHPGAAAAMASLSRYSWERVRELVPRLDGAIRRHVAAGDIPTAERMIALRERALWLDSALRMLAG